MKYIIKNCDAFSSECCYAYTCEEYDCTYCKEMTDCLLKQIVEKCKNEMDTIFNSASIFAEEILDMLEIEEIEE